MRYISVYQLIFLKCRHCEAAENGKKIQNLFAVHFLLLSDLDAFLMFVFAERFMNTVKTRNLFFLDPFLRLSFWVLAL